MNTAAKNHESHRWLTVVVFAVAMAWVESAVVYYLRTMIDRIEPHQPNPLPIIGGLGHAGLLRQAANILMLHPAGIPAGARRGRPLAHHPRPFVAWAILSFGFLWGSGGAPPSLCH